MRNAIRALVFLASLALVGCSGPDREWMKVNQPYTAEDFQRDYNACTKGLSLDEACMKSRGWVSVTPPKSTKPQEPLRARPGGGRY
jgi:hypothetical protein